MQQRPHPGYWLWRVAKPGEGSRWVSNPRWVRIGLRQPYLMQILTPGGTSGRVHLKVQRLWRRWQQVLLELLEQDVTPKEGLVTHCSLAVSCRNGSPCHWIKSFQAEKVGLPLCTGLLTIKLSRTGQFCNSSPGMQSHFRVHRWDAERKRHHRIRWTIAMYVCMYVPNLHARYIDRSIHLSQLVHFYVCMYVCMYVSVCLSVWIFCRSILSIHVSLICDNLVCSHRTLYVLNILFSRSISVFNRNICHLNFN